MQLRAEADKRPVPGSPRLGYTYVYGAPGLSGVNRLERGYEGDQLWKIMVVNRALRGVAR